MANFVETTLTGVEPFSKVAKLSNGLYPFCPHFSGRILFAPARRTFNICHNEKMNNF